MRSSHLFHLSLIIIFCATGQLCYAAKPAESNAISKHSVSLIPLSETLNASRTIDRLIETAQKKQGVKPNDISSDETFLRRIYLDVIGRIPSYDETISFLESQEANKRSLLIDSLLDSEGYVSHNFNYWADLLRLQSRMRYAPAKPYLEFVKNSLRENKPYDQFVRELITAEGYTWNNGAAGYYLRDTGMPLDNMSNTAQVFLGTQLVCAQCHDHPFDSWTQKQYYQMAAFTYGVQTRDRNTDKYRELRQMRRDPDMDRMVFQSANRILQPLAYRVNETDRALRLPKDYQYSNAEPNDQIDPATIFGDEVEIKAGDSPRDIYARWMTSSKNPRFATVISNRLWKRALGVGLIEPVDDFKDGVNPSNPQLMDFLVEQMVDSGYNIKQYLRTIYNSNTYQRNVSVNELNGDETYYFPGPVLRRMTSEQLWDSLLTMTIPYVDERKGRYQRNNRYGNGAELENMELKVVLERAEVEAKRRVAQRKFYEQTRDLQKELRVASKKQDRETVNRLREKIDTIRQSVYGSQEENRMQMMRKRYRKQARETDPRWTSFNRNLVRASEVESPARPGHFLRQFGQSDRETIENANADATVPQILTLLNGPLFNQLANRNSVLQSNLETADSHADQIEIIFLSILNRRPTDVEQEMTIKQFEIDKKNYQSASNIIWALLNTRQFMFVQ